MLHVFLSFTPHIQLTSKMLFFLKYDIQFSSLCLHCHLPSLNYHPFFLGLLQKHPNRAPGLYLPLYPPFPHNSRLCLKNEKTKQSKTNQKQMIVLDFWVKPYPLRTTLSESLTKLFKKSGRYSRIQEWPSPFYAQSNIFNQIVLLLTLGWLSHPSSTAEGAVHTSRVN